MGYLTTFTIYNDGIDSIEKDSKKFCEKLHYAAIYGEQQSFGHGSFGNLVNVQACRHADDWTTYVHKGNCVTEVNPFSNDFEKLIERNLDFAKSLVSFMKSQVRDAEKLIKKIESSTLIE